MCTLFVTITLLATKKDKLYRVRGHQPLTKPRIWRAIPCHLSVTIQSTHSELLLLSVGHLLHLILYSAFSCIVVLNSYFLPVSRRCMTHVRCYQQLPLKLSRHQSAAYWLSLGVSIWFGILLNSVFFSTNHT